MYIANSTGLFLQTMLYLSNQTNKAATDAMYDFPPAVKSDLNEVRCYGIYGCFPLTGPFTTNTRQISVHPQRPADIQPHFPVFNKANYDIPNFVDLKKPTDIVKFGINPYAKFFIIIHGYLEAGNKPWMLEMAKKLIQTEPDCSVMMIDWGAGSHPPYTQATANIRLVGAMAAHIIHLVFAETGMKNLDQVHMIGHSLGAHLSGYAGTTLYRDFGLKLGRITGLDPAAPLFSGTEPIVRLDRSDAKYVDVVHTDSNPLMSGGLGMNSPIGHVDFYPNGGYDNPGCGGGLHEHMTSEKSFFTSVQSFLGCNHVRSHQFFAESIAPKCGFNAISCDSYDSFKAGKCDRCGENNHHCIRFGYNSYKDYQKLLEKNIVSNNTSFMAYLSTSKSKPFCRNHYKITVRISNSEESRLHGGEIGTLAIKLHSRRRRETELMAFSSTPQYFEPGQQYVSVVPGKDIQNPTYATVTWDYQTNILNPLTWRIVETPRIYVDFISIESIENPKFEIVLCPTMNSAIVAGNNNILEVNNYLNEVRCYGIYGCFPLTGPFTTNTRQISVHPQRPADIQPHFPVFNKANYDTPNFVDLKKPTDIVKFGINPYAKFFIIIHGYLEAGNKPWMLEMAKKLIQTEPDCSVMMIDWGAGSHPPYTQATANIRLVGAMAAHIIHLVFAETGMKNLDQVHMIGHSLGAHLSGYAGTTLYRDFGLKLGRITGLDPAAPLFSGTEPIVRLDRSDAKYVDVVHTDSNPLMSGCLGMNSPIGHVDFYPNGGYDNPGCGGGLHEHMTSEKSFFTSVQSFLGCNHVRSHQFFAESIAPKCGFNAISCDSYDSFKAGKCDRCGENNHHCIRFGYNSYKDYQKLLEKNIVSNNTSFMAYLSTSKSKPFCRNHYKITVRISNSEESRLHGGEIGTLAIKLHSRRRRETELMAFSSTPQYFEPGQQYVSVVPGKDIQNPTYATVTWDYQTNILNPLTWRIVETPRIYVDFISIESIENPKFEIVLCPTMNSAIVAGNNNILEVNNCKF